MLATMACRICGSSAHFFFRDQREFYLCSHCNFIFTLKGIRGDKETAHYEAQHSNEYDWLKLSRLCIEYAGKFKDPATIYKFLDYGSGAGHLTRCLRLHGYHVDSYEPMYDTTPFVNRSSGYDVIVLNEVLEHIEDIHNTLETIYDVSNDGAIVLIFTVVTDDLLNNQSHFVSQFGSWWYKDDMTHVSFFCSLAFEHLCRRTGRYHFKLLGTHSRGALFRVCKTGEHDQRI